MEAVSLAMFVLWSTSLYSIVISAIVQALRLDFLLLNSIVSVRMRS